MNMASDPDSEINNQVPAIRPFSRVCNPAARPSGSWRSYFRLLAGLPQIRIESHLENFGTANVLITALFFLWPLWRRFWTAVDPSTNLSHHIPCSNPYHRGGYRTSGPSCTTGRGAP